MAGAVPVPEVIHLKLKVSAGIALTLPQTPKKCDLSLLFLFNSVQQLYNVIFRF